MSAPGFVHAQAIGGFEYPDGTVDPIVAINPEVGFDPDNRRLLGGREVRPGDLHAPRLGPAYPKKDLASS